MSFMAELHVAQGADRRRSARVPTRGRKALTTDTSQRVDILIRDLSQHGFRARIDRDLAIGAAVYVTLAGPQPFAATVVWHEGDEFGCAFATPISAVAVADAFSGRTVIE